MTSQLGTKCTPVKEVHSVEDGTSSQKVPLWGSCRLVYSVCAFFTLLNFTLMRFNLSFALVCMVKVPVTNSSEGLVSNDSQGLHTSDSDSCPVPASETGLPGFEGDFEWSKALQGHVLSGFFYGYLVSQGFGGWFSDRFGGKLLFILGNFLQSIITLLLPVATRYNAETLFALRIIQGIVCGLSLPAVFQLYTRWASPSERPKLMAIAYTGFPIGNVIIYPLSGFLCQSSQLGGWPSIFYATGLFGGSCSLIFHFLVYDSADKHPKISDKERRFLNECTVRDTEKPLKIPWKAILTSPPVYGYYIAHICFCWGFFTLAINLPMFMREVLLFDINQNGVLSAMPFVGVLIMRILIALTFTPLQKKLGLTLTRFRKINHTVGTLGAGMCVLGVSAVTCHDQYLAVILLTVSQAVCDVAFTGGYLMSFLDLAPSFAGFLTGISNTIGCMSGVLAPTLVGILTPNGTREEWMVIMYITGVVYFVGAVSYLFLGSSELQPWAVTTPGLSEKEASNLLEKEGSKTFQNTTEIQKKLDQNNEEDRR